MFKRILGVLVFTGFLLCGSVALGTVVQFFIYQYGTINIDTAGHVTGGIGTTSLGTSESYTGGYLTIDNFGTLDGTIVGPPGSPGFVRSGQMTPGKTVLSYLISSSNNDSYMSGVGIMGGGSFVSNNLQGDWHLALSHKKGAAFVYLTGLVSVDAGGNVTGGTWAASDGSTGTFTGGLLAITADGKVAGTINWSGGSAITLTDGKMDHLNGIFAFTAHSGMEYMVGTAVERDSGFATSDLNGIWSTHLVALFDDGFVYGVWIWVSLDAGGNVTAGGYWNTRGGVGTVTGGNLSLTANGELSGFIQADRTYTVSSGQLDSSKTFINLALNGSKYVGTAVKSGSGLATSDLNGTWYTYDAGWSWPVDIGGGGGGSASGGGGGGGGGGCFVSAIPE